jgi:hypothetical protein
MSNQRESVKVLQECIDLQLRKSRDYQNPNSTVKQADYYPNGVITIHDIMHAKMLRIKSVMEAMQSHGYDPNFESLEDSAKDLINYASFFVAYCRGEIPGQVLDHNIFNREIQFEAEKIDIESEDDGMITVSTLTTYIPDEK